MKKQVLTSFYQKRNGEIFAVVEEWENQCTGLRIVENIETFPWTSAEVFDAAKDAFSGFPLFDPYRYGGYSFTEYLLEMSSEEEEDIALIARIWNSGETELWPQNMGEKAREFFEEIGQYTEVEIND